MARELQPCGTRAAYLRHLYYHEVPCDACREACRAASQARRDNRRLTQQRRAVLAAAVYTTTPRRGTQRARQAALLRGEL